MSKVNSLPEARTLPEPVQWHEGMLLSPQHFQQAALRQELLVGYHAKLASPFHWGVRHLRIDPLLLVDGVFRVTELEAVLPDGLILTDARLRPEELSLELEPLKEDLARAPLRVHLAVPELRRDGSSLRGDLARYRSVEGPSVLDQNTGDSEIRIPRLRPRVLFLTGDEPSEKFSSLPLAEISYRNETFELGAYVPPLLRVQPASPIANLCASIAARLREKAVFLSERARSPNIAGKASLLLETKGRAHALVAGLPQFEAVLNIQVAHPFVLYHALCHLVGHLALLGNSLNPPVLPAYDHDDPLQAFGAAARFIDRVLAEGFIENYLAFPFTLEKEERFSLRFDPDWLGRKLVLGVRARSDDGEAEAATWLEHALIGSEGRLTSMRQRRVLGPRREPIEGDEDLVPARGLRLFAFDPDPDFVETDQDLIVFNPEDREGRRRPSSLVLYVRKPREERIDAVEEPGT